MYMHVTTNCIRYRAMAQHVTVFYAACFFQNIISIWWFRLTTDRTIRFEYYSDIGRGTARNPLNRELSAERQSYNPNVLRCDVDNESKRFRSSVVCVIMQPTDHSLLPTRLAHQNDRILLTWWVHRTSAALLDAWNSELMLCQSERVEPKSRRIVSSDLIASLFLAATHPNCLRRSRRRGANLQIFLCSLIPYCYIVFGILCTNWLGNYMVSGQPLSSHTLPNSDIFGCVFNLCIYMYILSFVRRPMPASSWID